VDCPFRILRKYGITRDTGLVPKDEESPMSNTMSRTHRSTGAFWSSRREAALNWLALGLLLAAWNASNNDAAANAPATTRSRPEALRGYHYVSVRAANRLQEVSR
jgi:hypothetical protein